MTTHFATVEILSIICIYNSFINVIGHYSLLLSTNPSFAVNSSLAAMTSFATKRKLRIINDFQCQYLLEILLESLKKLTAPCSSNNILHIRVYAFFNRLHHSLPFTLFVLSHPYVLHYSIYSYFFFSTFNSVSIKTSIKKRMFTKQITPPWRIIKAL